MTHDNIIEGMAEIFWGDGWANHVDEHECMNISGCEITEVMPPIPDEIYFFSYKILGYYEALNDTNIHALFWQALKADGEDPEYLLDNHKDKYNLIGKRFGNYLAYMAMGAGVSWFDDHESFKINIPYLENSDAMILAEEQCYKENHVY